ncbi:MAG: hypothetical protein KC621_13020 [Myxococcales bacterium]|nr:hypothetical protein [Myxococcales bacterium]
MSVAVVGAQAPVAKTSLWSVFAWTWLLSFGTLLGAGAAAVLGLGFGSGYYLSSDIVRAEHPMHQWLRPGGPGGVLLGVIGTTLMTIMLTYSIRKLLGTGRWFRWMGNTTWWLRFHMICGVMGPVYIVLHTGLRMPKGIIAIGFWCMVLVALSGLFGRYVYGHFPKSAAGKAMDLREAKSELADLRARLVAETADADGAAIGNAVALVHDFEREIHSIVGWLALDFEVRRRIDLVKVHLRRAGLQGHTFREASHTLVSQLELQRNLGAWEVSRRLFRWWHLFHNPLARAMYLIVALHLFNAIIFGGALSQLTLLVP